MALFKARSIAGRRGRRVVVGPGPRPVDGTHEYHSAARPFESEFQAGFIKLLKQV